MNSFLDRLAAAYYSRYVDSLYDTMFVFPNKRSGAFFRKSLREVSQGKLFFEPEIITIAEFVESLSKFTVANRFELLATLYSEYRKLSPEAEDFDRFIFWGDMLLKDFNDVDLYMADNHELFANIRNVREISTDYLTYEQRKVIEEYWNVTIPMADPDRFWNHIHHSSDNENHTTRNQFLSLWKILDTLYSNFNNSLNNRQLTYTGAQYREVASLLHDVDNRRDHIQSSRIVMAGFNMLSVAETRIFEALRDMGIGDFYWERDFPKNLIGVNNPALRFINRYAAKFPSLIDIDRHDPEIPTIEVVAIPGAVGQTKYVSSLLDKMSTGQDAAIPDPSNAINTAIVLPSEELFIEMLHSIPPQFTGGVNVTMGLPLRMTPVAMLISSVTRLHKRASLVKGEWHFFYEDICDVLANPLLNNVKADECNQLRMMLENKRMFTVPASTIAGDFPGLADVFYAVDDLRDAKPVFDYTLHLLDFIDSLLPDDVDSTNSDGNKDKSLSTNIERGFLLRYRMAMQSLRETLTIHDIKMKENTFFSLIERAIAPETAAFKGEPLKGLQIMGMLETRTLGFDNVIILSMNDRVYPRRHWTNSFIPEILRRAYGISTANMQESMSAYYFYRLIAGARHVTILYDARTDAGDPSRYIHQLQFNLPCDKIVMRQFAYTMTPNSPVSAYSITKTPEIMDRINRYISTGSDKKYLSASSINTYLSCPLHFYFENIRDLTVADEIVDYIDYSDYGSILHRAAENIYKLYRGNAGEVLITVDLLDTILKSDVIIPREVTNAINQLWHRLPNQHPDATTDKDEPYLNTSSLTGEALIIHGLMVKTLRKMFELEKAATPFYFVDGEMSLKVRLKLNDSLTINLKGYIDRVDRLTDGTIRLIDYKTGGDQTDLKEPLDAFETSGRSSPNKAVRQLFIYANAYSEAKNYTGAIQPMIYKLKSVVTQTALDPITIGNIPVFDYHVFNSDMMTMLNERLSSLFDPHVPITADPDENHCNFCQFKLLCGLSKERKF